MEVLPAATAPGPSALRDRQVVVWGMGRHGGGVAAADWCAKHGARVSVLEARAPAQLPAAGAVAAARGWPWHTGNAHHPCLRTCDLLVPSPAIPPQVLAAVGRPVGPIVSPEGLFFAHHRGPRVCVTGTKGKSTTAAILGALLGWPVAGNSNEPLLAALARTGPDQPLICELSSFQLWYLRRQQPRLDAVVITNLDRDHLDWHGSLADYRRSKLACLAWTGLAVLPDELAAVAPETCRVLPPTASRDGHWITDSGQHIAACRDLPLAGNHNHANASQALALALELGTPPERAGERLATVTPLPHRLDLVHEVGRLRFVDDSIATTPAAVLAAIASIDGPLAVILGGSDKGADFAPLARAVRDRGAAAVAIGATAPTLRTAFARLGYDLPVGDSLEAAVDTAVAALGAGGGTVLLSPACASFGMFSDYEERGARFTACARRYRGRPDDDGSDH